MSLEKLQNAASTEERKNAALEIALEIADNGVDSLVTSGILKALTNAISNGRDAVAREGGAVLFEALATKLEGAAVPYLTPSALKVLELSADKKSPVVRNASVDGVVALFNNMSTRGMYTFFMEMLELAENTTKWQTKVAVLKALEALVESCPEEIQRYMVEIVPKLSALMWDSKKQVKQAAADALVSACRSIDNNDVQPFVPTLISAIQNPSEVQECIHALAATTFVQAVDDSALSITVPILARGFKERVTATKRKTAVITENMAKLVEDPAMVAPFMPVLEPLLAKTKDEVADPECRSRTAAAHQALLDINSRPAKEALKEVEEKTILATIKKVAEKNGGKSEGPGHEEVAAFVAKVIKQLIARNCDDEEDWKDDLAPIMGGMFPKNVASDEDKLTEVAAALRAAFEEDFKAAAPGEVEEEDEDTLCNCKFSLAYGSRILLNNAQLHLKRGRRYGIIASKSAGKTTLLRAINNGQVEGFPDASELKTVFVEHDIQGSQVKMNVVDFTLDSVSDCGVSREDVVETLHSIGFTDQMKEMPITSLSGGWKMKLALARAMLQKADILLLDEPTNHLDVLNVQWVVDYLTGETCKNVTSLIVSHDTGFLDKTATHIIHFETLKLATYTGNISDFVERFPAAKAYFDLKAGSLKFKFPDPAPLDGVKARGKAILQMTKVEFTYPGAPSPQLYDVTIRVSMASRVACVGANGAGKSTMIKLLTGELKPSKGSVVKHPNCRFAYVAQHAFHHIEQHLDKTPNEYIQWRYQGGEDKEALQKVTAKFTDEEIKKMKTPIVVQYEDEDGKKIKEKRVLEKIISRRKTGKIHEYEVKWVGKSQDLNTWYPRDTLFDLGFKKLCEELDRRKAAQEGMFTRTLSQRNVEKHLEDVGLDKELGTHNRISSLSGGQKVKVVLAAATWSNPHLIILDEPTNYLDRESLGALAGAIEEFQGGVVLITHNKEFAEATTRETWVVANNRCDIKGDAEWEKYAAEQLELQAAEDMLDAAGNKVELKRTPASVPLKKKKKMIKELKKKIKNDEEMTEFEEECAYEWDLFSA